MKQLPLVEATFCSSALTVKAEMSFMNIFTPEASLKMTVWCLVQLQVKLFVKPFKKLSRRGPKFEEASDLFLFILFADRLNSIWKRSLVEFSDFELDSQRW